MAKKNQVEEKKQGTFKRIIEVVKFTAEYKPNLILFLIIAFIVPVIVGVVLTVILGLWFTIILGVMLGLIFAMLVLSRNADKAGYESVEGKPGASQAILNTVNKLGWVFEEDPIYADPKTMDLIFVGYGRAGAVLVVEGPINRINKQVSIQEKRIQRAVPDLTIAKIFVGNGKGQVPIPKLRKKIMKLKPTLSKQELELVKKRLKSLLGFKLPIPKGIDPNRMRPSHKNQK
jgi:hypothetical protein